MLVTYFRCLHSALLHGITKLIQLAWKTRFKCTYDLNHDLKCTFLTISNKFHTLEPISEEKGIWGQPIPGWDIHKNTFEWIFCRDNRLPYFSASQFRVMKWLWEINKFLARWHNVSSKCLNRIFCIRDMITKARLSFKERQLIGDKVSCCWVNRNHDILSYWLLISKNFFCWKIEKKARERNGSTTSVLPLSVLTLISTLSKPLNLLGNLEITGSYY